MLDCSISETLDRCVDEGDDLVVEGERGSKREMANRSRFLREASLTPPRPSADQLLISRARSLDLSYDTESDGVLANHPYENSWNERGFLITTLVAIMTW